MGWGGQARFPHVMAVVHGHMPAVAGQRWRGVAFTGQQGHSFGEDSVYVIGAVEVGLVAVLDGVEIAFGPFHALLGSAKNW